MAAVISPTAGTRTEPMDSYTFVRGTTCTFKTMYTNEGVPVTLDTDTDPKARIFMPAYSTTGNTPVPQMIATLIGTLVPGQLFEYQFTWDIPLNIQPSDQWIIRYEGTLGGITMDFGDEFFTLTAMPGQVGLRTPSYATVDDVRAIKFSIDDYLPKVYANDLTARNNLIEKHLRMATIKLREELAVFKARGNSENYKLFCCYYTVFTLLLAARGEDGSSISEQNVSSWKALAYDVLRQEKREGSFQGVPLGRG